MVISWVMVFVVSLILLVKGADWLLERAEKIGLALGLSPFIIGVVLVGLGTSFPEIASSFAAMIRGVSEIVVANAVGSNIANILLVVGISAIVGKKLVVTKNLIDLDLPLLSITTTIFIGVAWDGLISIQESVLLLVLFLIYMTYTFMTSNETNDEDNSLVKLPTRSDGKQWVEKMKSKVDGLNKMDYMDFVVLGVGILALGIGAHFLVESVMKISNIFSIGVGPITLVAVAVGTSLPELLVSIKAAMQNKAEVALGNIFGSNIFNILFVIGLPGLLGTINIDSQTLNLGIPVMVAATILFVISGISRQIYRYEGEMFLVLYIAFLGHLVGIL